MFPRPLILSALISLMFTGCATQQALTERTRPLEDRIGNLERALKASDESLKREVFGFNSMIKVIVSKLGEQMERGNRMTARQDAAEIQAGALNERIGLVERHLGELAATSGKLAAEAAEARQQLNERATQAELRLDELATTSGETAAEAAEERQRLAERAGQAELRLDELATTSGKNAAEAAGERQRLAERVAQAEQRLNELAKTSRETSAEEGRKLAERIAQAEARLDELATSLPKRLAQTEQRLDGLSGSVKEALAQAAQENIRINGKEAFTVLLTEDKTLYPINSPELGSQDVTKLDQMVGRLAKLDRDYHLEIRGHTDNIGNEDYNYELGKARADVVKRFLHDKRGIALSQMSIISFGAANPLDRNGAHNRRIEIRVLVLRDK